MRGASGHRLDVEVAYRLAEQVGIALVRHAPGGAGDNDRGGGRRVTATTITPEVSSRACCGDSPSLGRVAAIPLGPDASPVSV